jgi:acetolactate synthase-1/2/3 large subunit
MKLTGAQALIKSLEMEQVEVMFGLPGGAILPVYDPLIDSSIRHILVRHEQGAGHMASGYAHATGRPGVAMVTSGPAATNIVTPLCDAYMDSIPIVVITGQVAYSVIGTDAFQEADTVGITMPVTKHNWLISDAQDIPRVVREAFHVATTGRPGPVLIDLPKDVANAPMEWYWPEKVDMPGYKPNVKGHPRQIKDAAKLINEARQPVIYAGGGIMLANASNELRALARCRRPTCSSRSAPASTIASPARCRRSRPTPRSSTSTSTPRSWARCASPMCRSWATCARSSRR